MIKRVPVQFIQYSITKKQMNILRTFLLLKHISGNGRVCLNPELWISIQDILAISHKTFRRHIDALVKDNWIGMDMHRNIYLRRWSSLELLSGIRFRATVEFHINYVRKECYKGYFFGAIMGYQCRLQLAKKWKERKKGRSDQFQNSLCPLSVSYLSAILGISSSSVQFYKSQAVRYGFIFKSEHRELLMPLDSKLNITLLRSYWEDSSFPYIKSGNVLIRKADRYYPILTYKRFRYGQNKH